MKIYISQILKNSSPNIIIHIPLVVHLNSTIARILCLKPKSNICMGLMVETRTTSLHRLLRKTKPKRNTMALTAQVIGLGLAFYSFLYLVFR